ncbi:RNA methyltransferase [soil metagenome]
MDHIVDAQDPRLADYRNLTDAEARRRIEGDDTDGIFIVEGVLALQQLRDSDHQVRSVVVTPGRAESLSALLSDLAGGGAQILVAERSVLAGVTGYDVHRGVLAVARRRPLPDLAQILGAARRVVVLEGLNDHENLGSVFRNCAALDVDAVLLDDRSADPLYRRSIRVSLGWAMRVPYTRIGPLPEGIEALRAAGWTTIALTPAPDSVAVDHAVAAGLLDDPVALVVGAEGPGLSPTTMAACDHRVRIPMREGVDSLNVATALAVVASFAAAQRSWT